MGKVVMVVDDSATIRRTLSFVLERDGYSVVEACNGSEALEMAKDLSVGLFISDVNMPVMDGIEFVKNIKSNSKHKFTPVIMLTTEAGSDKVKEGKAAGAKAWIVKPFSPESLLEAVKKLFCP